MVLRVQPLPRKRSIDEVEGSDRQIDNDGRCRLASVRAGPMWNWKTLTAVKDKSAATTTLRYSVFLKLHLLSVPDVSDTADYSWWVELCLQELDRLLYM